MTPVIKAYYSQLDQRYPVVVSGPDWWEKMSIEETLALAKELHEAAAQAQINEILVAA
jgi:hypothetical protein